MIELKLSLKFVQTALSNLCLKLLSLIPVIIFKIIYCFSILILSNEYFKLFTYLSTFISALNITLINFLLINNCYHFLILEFADIPYKVYFFYGVVVLLNRFFRFTIRSFAFLRIYLPKRENSPGNVNIVVDKTIQRNTKRIINNNNFFKHNNYNLNYYIASIITVGVVLTGYSIYQTEVSNLLRVKELVQKENELTIQKAEIAAINRLAESMEQENKRHKFFWEK